MPTSSSTPSGSNCTAVTRCAANSVGACSCQPSMASQSRERPPIFAISSQRPSG
jgi:hypothetical protein